MCLLQGPTAPQHPPPRAQICSLLLVPSQLLAGPAAVTDTGGREGEGRGRRGKGRGSVQQSQDVWAPPTPAPRPRLAGEGTGGWLRGLAGEQSKHRVRGSSPGDWGALAAPSSLGPSAPTSTAPHTCTREAGGLRLDAGPRAHISHFLMSELCGTCGGGCNSAPTTAPRHWAGQA